MPKAISDQSLRRRLRRQTGNIIATSVIACWAVSSVLLFCCSVGALVLVQSAVQRVLDDAALSGACQLNLGNQIGQMNNVIARSRQLVYADRQMDNQLLQSGSAYEKLSAQLLAQSRDSAQTIDTTRAKLITTSTQAANQAVAAAFTKASTHQSLTLPGLKIGQPALIRTTLGTVEDVHDNAFVLPQLQNLLAYDQSQSFINKQSNLYVEQINAKLPAPDNDLNFNLSSLQAYINNNTAPSRLMLGQSFQPQDDQQLHSAIQLESQLTVSLLSIPYCSTTLHLTSTATTNGDGQFP